MERNKSYNKMIYVAIIIVMALFAFIGVGTLLSKNQPISQKSLDDLYAGVSMVAADQVKGSVNLTDKSLYDELPDISKSPLAVEGHGDIALEVFSSSEKSGTGHESWLIDVANEFNSAGIKTSAGKTVSISVRSVPSGLGADYIISKKYLPDLYAPSNKLLGEYINAQSGSSVTEVTSRLVGNTAGILITKGKGYSDFDSVVEAVKNNEINLGYTNPQTSSTGINFLMTFLSKVDKTNLTSDLAASEFSKFQNNIPFVADTTMQMRDSATTGSLDGMVMEYQTYINEQNLKSNYDFIPFGVRHDNPLYITSKASGKEEAVNLFKDFALNNDMQKLATEKGFNANNDYKSEISVTGAEVSQALQFYKQNKDSGKDVIAVFVADCSGSMAGDAINQLKDSLSNGVNYINGKNYVGLVSYSSKVTIELPIAKFDLNQRSYFQGSVNRLTATGSTATYEAITVALKMIKDAKVSNPDAKTMIFLLSDGLANGKYTLNTIENVLKEEETPIYTISYTSAADKNAMNALSSVNEAASINADSDDIIYKIKSLFNSHM